MLLCTSTSNAQLQKPTPASTFSEKLGMITQAFRNNYYQIQGAQLPSQDDMDVFSSSITLPNAKHCVIYRFHSKKDTTASWQAVMYEGDNYKEALKAYKNTCKLVDRTKVNLSNVSAAFNGKIDEPETDLRFVSSLFRLNTKEEVYEKFFAEVELVNINFDQWEVHLNLQSKKDDMDE